VVVVLSFWGFVLQTMFDYYRVIEIN
jgi:hypothetical protein